jgi:hypothetical protein
MPSVKVEDRVEPTGVLLPMKVGVITRIIPNTHNIEAGTQYEVDFGQTQETFLSN